MLRAEVLRAFLLESLKPFVSRTEGWQYSDCLSSVTEIVKLRGMEQLLDGSDLRDEDAARLKHVIWDLILERVLIPGTNDPRTINDGWPSLSMTDHGRKVVAEQKPTPYDPDGYIERLKRSTGGLHPTTEAYLAEAICTFRTGSNMASAVMLGAASEMLIIELCQAISDSFSNQADKSKFDRKTGPRSKMADRVNALTNWLVSKKQLLPPDWQNPERHRLIIQIAELIRNRRNNTGHPQNPPMTPSHEEMYALLMLFLDYCEKLHALGAWLHSKKGSIT